MWRIQAFDREGRELTTVDVAGGEVTVGREADRRIVLASPSVSRRHAKFVLDGPQPYVMDEGSANGVLVNGVRIGGPTAVVPGTHIDIAEFRLEFNVAQQVAPAYGGQGGYGARAPAPAPQPLRLFAEDGPFAGQVFELKMGTTALGRAIDNDLVFDDPSLSRKHSRVRNNGDQLEVEDCGSSNGTFVNGRRVEGVAVARPGDLVRFGELHFRVEGDRPPQQQQQQPAAPVPSYDEPMVPARGGVSPALVYGGAAGLVAIIGVLAALLLFRGGKSTPAVDTVAQMQTDAAQHLKAGKEKLDSRDFVAAQKEFDQVLQADPANPEARRLRAVATAEPDNEQLSKKAKVKLTMASSRSEFEDAMRLANQIPTDSVFHDQTVEKVTSRLVAFGKDQCKGKKYLDCAWAICKAYDAAPTAQRATLVPADADAAMRDAESKLKKEKGFTPCKVKR